MANTQPTDTLSGILGAMEFPQAPDLNAFSTGGTTPQPAPTSPGELDSMLNSWQNQALTAADQDWSTYFEQTGTEEMGRLRETLMPGEEMPRPPSMTEEFQRQRVNYGLDELEQGLAELKREERNQQAIRRERISGTFEERTRMSAIQGQVSEIERQEMERIDFINREIAYRTDILNSAYKIIDMSMNYLNMDWQNAKEWWTTQFNANLSMYKQLRGEFEADRSFEQQQKEWEQSVATANLQIYADMISNGQVFWQDMDEATKTEIAKLEVKSGLGAGFLSKLRMDPDKNIKSITTRDVSGTRYADIVKVDPRTGKVSVESVKVGSVSMPSSGGATASRNEYGYTEKEWNSKVADARSYLLKLEKQYEKDIEESGGETGTGKYGGDQVLADWEIKKANKEFNARYGSAGTDLLYEALTTGGYKTWDFKNNKVAPLSILGI